MIDILSGLALATLIGLWIALLRYYAYLHEEDDEDVY